ncbi:MAG: hypothetical protein A2511_03680 [Deltaproteobacteria bacterium RIFOXYD12_FULL_50_9]|nr:MAG: hypothetical protein A2511_03680 [Deltaproteobacteria bacterium RIFOXYD12_FULL_50_9]
MTLFSWLNLSVEHLLIRRLLSSVVGRILIHQQCRAVIERMSGPKLYNQAEIESLAEHVTRFSLAGIRQVMADNRQMAGA